MTEGGKWLVQNELASQAILQGAYQLFSPWRLSAMEIMNLASCLGGALAVWILLQYSRLLNASVGWALLLFFSSGFSIYTCGHTEYYPLVLPAMLLYGYLSVLYLRGRLGITLVALTFLAAAGFHFAMLIALPSLFLLPWLRKRRRDWLSIGIWLILLAPLFLIRNNPQILGHKAAGLSPAWNFLSWLPYEGMDRYYAVLQWGHWADWMYAWAMRSWIFWPAVVCLVAVNGLKTLFDQERFFLLIYTLSFTIWTMLWHPDLGVEADWDLFAIEAAPCLMLLLTYIPAISKRNCFYYMLLACCIVSIVINYLHIRQKMGDHRLGYGAMQIKTPAPIQTSFTLRGLNRPLSMPRIREGVYSAKLIDQTHRCVYEMYIWVDPGGITEVKIE
ncbi:MAG: hypothetical protein JXR73_22615 [Candidatus Omnitrophica bacterium]|nr:hypothetical protein [Candidatus Omnitrophota bacterium]